jgi:hypothetical protein
MKGNILLKILQNAKCGNGVVSIGEAVRIEGDINLTKNIVNVPYNMAYCINDNKIYEVEEIKESVKGPIIIRVNGWWWGAQNISKIHFEDITPIEPQLFQIDQLDI